MKLGIVLVVDVLYFLKIMCICKYFFFWEIGIIGRKKKGERRVVTKFGIFSKKKKRAAEGCFLLFHYLLRRVIIVMKS
jgi:hypothetical protein